MEKNLHDANAYGSQMVGSFIQGKKFPFPKSVYAVFDILQLFLTKKKNALLVDFFAGSGTTLHALNLLNATDGGNRRCILVTNNEVSVEEAENLRIRGLQPGDSKWEELGICRSVTWPRSKLTIMGKREDGLPLSGDYLTGKTVFKEKSRKFTWIGFLDSTILDSTSKKKQVLGLIDGLPQVLVNDSCPFIVSKDHKTSILFDIGSIENWIEALDGQEHITDFYIVTLFKKEFDNVKARVIDLLGPILASEDEKFPMSDGFKANLAYFKLDFLDKDQVALKRAFREILPLLWMKAGSKGVRPELPAKAAESVMFVPDGNNFAVLLDEIHISKLIKSLLDRDDLSHVFIVTDAEESFKAIAAEVVNVLGKKNPSLNVVQLYRDYLVNFMINTQQDSTVVVSQGI